MASAFPLVYQQEFSLFLNRCIPGYREKSGTAVRWVQKERKTKPRGRNCRAAEEAGMAGTYGKVFSLAKENEPVPGCTISGALVPGVTVFSLGAGTDISAERYPAEGMQLMLAGKARLEYGSGKTGIELVSGDAVIKEAGSDIGVRAPGDAVYVEILSGKEDVMNSAVKAGEVFRLAELVPFREGRIVNMDVMSGPRMKFAVMAFDAGCALPPHAAPGDAIVFALERSMSSGRVRISASRRAISTASERRIGSRWRSSSRSLNERGGIAEDKRAGQRSLTFLTELQMRAFAESCGKLFMEDVCPQPAA